MSKSKAYLVRFETEEEYRAVVDRATASGMSINKYFIEAVTGRDLNERMRKLKKAKREIEVLLNELA